MKLRALLAIVAVLGMAVLLFLPADLRAAEQGRTTPDIHGGRRP